jgi:hypothetical protein
MNIVVDIRDGFINVSNIEIELVFLKILGDNFIGQVRDIWFLAIKSYWNMFRVNIIYTFLKSFSTRV